MKKSLIAGAGAAAFAFAALPFAGVFAATSTVTDEIVVNIPQSCAITTSNTDSTEGIGDGAATENQYSASMQNGQLKSDIGGTDSETGKTNANVISVACNTPTGGTAPTWRLTAQGGDFSGAEGAFVASTVMDAAGNGTDIATGTGTTGETSNWAMKVTGGTGVTIQNGYDDFSAVPGTVATIAEGQGSVSAAFTTLYQVYIGTSQEADTYTGHVTYTLTSPRV